MRNPDPCLAKRPPAGHDRATSPRGKSRAVPATTPVSPEPSLEEAAEIHRFWEEHYAELLAGYPEMFVAVRDGHVVAANPDLAFLVYDLRDKHLDPRKDVAIEFISSNSARLLL